MTPKQILDSFSETLMRDERILSTRERSLLATLLQHAKAATSENPETQDEKLEHVGKALRSVEQGILSPAYLRSRVHE